MKVGNEIYRHRKTTLLLYYGTPQSLRVYLHELINNMLRLGLRV